MVEPELPAAIGMAPEVGVEEAPNRQGGDDDRDDDRQLPNVRADPRPELIAPVPQRVEEVVELEPGEEQDHWTAPMATVSAGGIAPKARRRRSSVSRPAPSHGG